MKKNSVYSCWAGCCTYNQSTCAENLFITASLIDSRDKAVNILYNLVGCLSGKRLIQKRWSIEYLRTRRFIGCFGLCVGLYRAHGLISKFPCIACLYLCGPIAFFLKIYLWVFWELISAFVPVLFPGESLSSWGIFHLFYERSIAELSRVRIKKNHIIDRVLWVTEGWSLSSKRQLTTVGLKY